MKMNMLKIVALAVLATAIAFAPTQGLAQEKKTEKSETASEKSDAPKDGKKKGLPGRGKVGAIDKTAKTIKLGNRTFHVTEQTRIIRNNQPAKLDDAVVGEDAGVSYREVDGKLMALTLRLGPVPERAPKGEKKGGEKKEKQPKE